MGRDEVLERVDGLVDWGALEAVCGEVYAAPVGRPSYPLRVLIKALLVQAWWNLSDPKAEQLLRNDLRFRRFDACASPSALGVGLSGRTPDQNTLWRFRDELSKRGLAERLLAEADRQLRARGFVMRRGAIVDATLIRSAASSKNRRKDGTAVDADADRTTRDGRDPTLGDKLHAAVDEDTGIVRRIALMPACCHDRRIAEAMVPEDVGDLGADAAYDASDLRAGLEARSLTPVIAHNPRRGGLRSWQRAANFVVKTVRPKIEPVFGTLKRSFGPGRARSFSLARNRGDPTFRVLAFHLHRAVSLSPPISGPPQLESARSPRNPPKTRGTPAQKPTAPTDPVFAETVTPSTDTPSVLPGGLVTGRDPIKMPSLINRLSRKNQYPDSPRHR